MITKIAIYGERCSGTNYLENIIKINFDIELTKDYGHKHFFGFNNLSNSDDTLFICIVRNPYDWFNSFYQNPHHLCLDVRKNTTNFLNNTIFSFNDANNSDESKEIMKDRNIYTNERYKNILELRHLKLKYLIETLPLQVKNHIIIRYEDIIDDFDNQMNRLLNFNLKIKENIIFPLNNKIHDYKYGGNYIKKTRNEITKEMIYEHKDFIKTYEEILGYIK